MGKRRKKTGQKIRAHLIKTAQKEANDYRSLYLRYLKKLSLNQLKIHVFDLKIETYRQIGKEIWEDMVSK